MTIYVKVCPACQAPRPLGEDVCANDIGAGNACEFDLMHVGPSPIAVLGSSATDNVIYDAPAGTDPAQTEFAEAPAEPPTALGGTACPNGHLTEADDVVCLTCGSALGITPPAQDRPERTIGDWQIAVQLPPNSSEAELFLGRKIGEAANVLLRYFRSGFEPDPSIYRVLERLDSPMVPHLVGHGRVDGRAYEAWEHVEGPTLAEFGAGLGSDDIRLEEIATALIAALALFERRGLRHGSVQPAVVRVRESAPLTLCITDFATASVAEFDVEASRLRQPSRYMAPEVIADASTASSDWWSVGIIILELLTQGRCFAGVHERAFLLHLVARGITLPQDLPPRWRNLLEGLLTRNHETRWKANEALRWASGETDIPTHHEGTASARPAGPELIFAGQKFTSPPDLAFAAAEETNWPEALSALEHGKLSSWIASFEKKDKKGENYDIVSRVEAETDQRVPADLRLALALAAMNRELPLCIRGTLLTPTTILADPASGARWLSPTALSYVRKLKRPKDHWLIQLADRAARVRSRAQAAKLPIDEEQFKVLQLVTSTAALDARWTRKRSLFPDSANATVSGLLERRVLSDEDLLLLCCLSHSQFKSTEEVLREAEVLATQAGIGFDRAVAATTLARPRRTLADELNARVPGFEQCDRPVVNTWMDAYRTANRRMPLSRMLVALAVPQEEWVEPPHQDYVKNVLGHLQRRVLAGIQRGPLIQMRATASVLDLTGLQNPNGVHDLLDAIVSRADAKVALGTRGTVPAGFVDKLRALENKARTYSRDTGLDALYIGFPILTLLDRSDDADRTRIAPLILWPIKLTVTTGATGSLSISFDPGREVQLNPALDTILGSDTAATWSTWAGHSLTDSFEDRAAVLRALSDLVNGDVGDTISPLPTAASVKGANKPAIRSSAALFLAEFPSQAIASDLKLLQQKPLDGTALQCLLRLRRVEHTGEPAPVSHLERFATLESDPSQEQAVLRSRFEPGLVVQGPPGTGKSQTIVNIIADCIGRGESVLVVCEKKAALDVVQKRLVAEKLGERVVRVENTQVDRTTVLLQLRTQVPNVIGDLINHVTSARQKRQPIGGQIDAIEKALDDYHSAVHAIDPRLEMSYRDVLSIIARENRLANGLSAPGLRAVLGPSTLAELESVIGSCSGLADVWLTGGLPGAPLALLTPTATDSALAARISDGFAELRHAEAERAASLAERARLAPEYRNLAASDPVALANWLRDFAQDMLVATAATLEQIEKWRPFFATGGAYLKDANETRVALSRLVENLDTLAMSGAATLAHEAVCGWPATQIEALSRALPAFRAPATILNMFNLSTWLQRRNAQKILRTHNVATDRSTCTAYAEAASFEHSVKGHARQLSELFARLAIRTRGLAATRRDLLVAARAMIDNVDAFSRFAERIDACPVQDVWNYLTRCVLANSSNGNTPATVSPTKPVLEPLVQGFETAVRVAATRLNSLDALDRLRPHLCEPSANDLHTAITGDRPTTLDHSSVQAALPQMVAYQTFRLRHALLSEAAKRSFAELQLLAPHIPALRPGDTIAAILRREAACAWKDDIETTYPHLRQLQSELDERIAELDRLDGQMRHANRTLLSKVDRTALSPQSQWEKIWMLTGENAKSLRQVFDSGRALGLLKMRPVWLVNPDVASRMLPLEPGLFDVVIFDEASQMRVVNAVPSLYRAKRCVISGDEKQLPPTTFFGSKSDEPDNSGVEDEQAFAAADNAEPEDDAEAQSNSIDPRELASSERHIKDCEDLLALARGLLPQASLDIHYRSEFRELIAFSNAAYYGGRLNVPIAKSVAAVTRAKPIEVRRVDGIYLNQTNANEADAVVDILAQLWAQRPAPPTVGIVTFNMKQAELIAARLDAKADQDREFGKALIRERTRTDKGEDVGFFVKNLENVQGDERDWIVFSTTFGRDEAGVFKRVFGALNQQGGERRLNVAVTRAKQKVMLVTSMPTAEISSFVGQRRAPTLARDYLQSYMRYAELIDEGALDGAAHILGSFESAPRPDTEDAAEPDELVLQALLALQGAGFQAAAMPLKDAFSLEIAVTDPTTSQYALGIEFDSPRHVLLRHARAREVWRPKLLAKSGMKLHRIVSSEWVRDPATQKGRLIEAAQNAIDGLRS